MEQLWAAGEKWGHGEADAGDAAGSARPREGTSCAGLSPATF